MMIAKHESDDITSGYFPTISGRKSIYVNFLDTDQSKGIFKEVKLSFCLFVHPSVRSSAIFAKMAVASKRIDIIKRKVFGT